VFPVNFPQRFHVTDATTVTNCKCLMCPRAADQSFKNPRISGILNRRIIKRKKERKRREGGRKERNKENPDIRHMKKLWCDFDRASSSICGNKMPTRYNRGFYCRSYCLLNMFRAPICPSSGAQEYYTVVAACGISCILQTGHITLSSTPDQ